MSRRCASRAVFWRGDPGYEDARIGRIFNARRPDRYPAAVLLAADEDDVVAGVRLARERACQVSVRAGGHSWAAWSVRDDALLIDLGGLREMAYDPATGIATARPAVQGGTELVPFLAVARPRVPRRPLPERRDRRLPAPGRPGVEQPHVRLGVRERAAIDVVTADGELIRADADQNADLLWAARGAGPGFSAWSPGSTCAPIRSRRDDPRHVDVRGGGPGPLLGWIDEMLPSLDRSSSR